MPKWLASSNGGDSSLPMVPGLAPLVSLWHGLVPENGNVTAGILSKRLGRVFEWDRRKFGILEKKYATTKNAVATTALFVLYG